MNLYDQHYRKLFSSPAMVRALFDGFLPEHLQHSLDLDTLTPLSSNFISGRNRDRRADGIWQIKRLDGSMLYVLILLEHQSRPDRMMSIRIMGYCALLYEDIVMRTKKGKPAMLPAVLPIVLYSGEKRWNVPLQVSELLDTPPAGLQIYQPQMRYLVLDEGALVEQANLPENNLAALLFQLEHNQGLEQIQETLQAILRLTQEDPAHHELSRVFGSWIRHVLIPRSIPDSQTLPDATNLQEVTAMLTTHSRDWSYRWRQEGRKESAATMLSSLLQHKFGALPTEITTRLDRADTEQLQAWSLNVLDAKTLQDVFRD